MSTTTNTSDFCPCKCCDGAGIQILNTGERIVCKACGGSGKWADAVGPKYPQPIWHNFDSYVITEAGLVKGASVHFRSDKITPRTEPLTRDELDVLFAADQAEFGNRVE